jgi:hypothetical protein
VPADTSGMRVDTGDKHFQASVERTKAMIEHAKHLTTLSTGSIVLVATFIEKAFPAPVWRPVATLSLLAFLLSILAAVVFQATTIPMIGKTEASDRAENVGAGSLMALWLAFFIGILLLALFAARNLLR